MKVVFSGTFQAGYRKLSKSDQLRVDKAIRLLAAKEPKKPFHPGLRAKRVQGTSDIWEATATMRIRLTFQMYRETLYLRVVGDHDKTLGRP
jgi:mRNA-degrading endonuclease YafQ of YafQ-DinJ toxin-antitoxin module